jgi:hypothetical protein
MHKKIRQKKKRPDFKNQAKKKKHVTQQHSFKYKEKIIFGFRKKLFGFY